ncbi:UDP-N-acetylmuramoyl-tripeptide--D-alanyl-D-alanine ligase [Clostridium oryzae]|uniref:UDP-N-acetylmuramoyl-tripeptide--D-alanyl-D-alanine ligase n=1 Tax=Clostridium oryzae TaxID=1450648 RepID=A0A1V4ITK7_9CLOT|nr:UDP-N-acetylmuramoyl-tripeptide--D-alanyl-D-alanine ligase [Clostridium oryzae]OPJ63239.1 UDP-N-acetylmuramoyl-tripeptide--D-alanyl-D-alanine ligase [Clostridium oryzae]
MKQFTLEELLACIDGKIVLDKGNYDYKNICIDTRKLKCGDMYIAIKGAVFDGNDFTEKADESGAAICIVDDIKYKEENIKNSTIIKVKDTLKAIRQMAKLYRSKLDIKVIGVTGSTGKTTTKDLIAAALSKKYKVFKTKGNFNNEIGLPLMVFSLDESYDVAVLEMGMSNLGEIHRLADIAAPNIAVITNIGVSHLENLHTRENILKAKLEITDFFQDDNTLIVNGENDLLHSYETESFKLRKIGLSESYNYGAENILLETDRVEYNLIEENSHFRERIIVPMPGKHNVINSLIAVACARIMGVSIEEIKDGFNNLEKTSMRLDIVDCGKFTMIDDSYNASPDSMYAALEVQSSMKAKRKIAVLGTMRELGEDSYLFHKEVGAFAKNSGVDILIARGEFSKAYEEGFNSDNNFYCFPDNESIEAFLKQNLQEGDLILIKASRTLYFDKIANNIKSMNSDVGGSV